MRASLPKNQHLCAGFGEEWPTQSKSARRLDPVIRFHSLLIRGTRLHGASGGAEALEHGRILRWFPE